MLKVVTSLRLTLDRTSSMQTALLNLVPSIRACFSSQIFSQILNPLFGIIKGDAVVSFELFLKVLFSLILIQSSIFCLYLPSHIFISIFLLQIILGLVAFFLVFLPNIVFLDFLRYFLFTVKHNRLPYSKGRRQFIQVIFAVIFYLLLEISKKLLFKSSLVQSC